MLTLGIGVLSLPWRVLLVALPLHKVMPRLGKKKKKVSKSKLILKAG
jgi:hypothetical protein